MTDDELQYYYDNAAQTMQTMQPQMMPPKKKGGAVKIVIIVAVVLALIAFLFPPLTLHTTSVKLYPVCRAITGHYKNIHEPEWFGDFAGDVESDFAFDYMPSFMQGTGHYTVRFKTSPETAKAYADKFSGSACYKFALSQYGDTAWTSVRDLGYEFPEAYDDSLVIQRDEEFWSGHEETARVYVTDAVLGWNHPHSSAVIVDEESGMVELSRLG